MNLMFENETYAIRGAIYEVYNTLGAGFLEGVYQEALELELKARDIPYKPQSEITVSYKGVRLKQTYRADIICFDSIVLELKAVKQLLSEHQAQLQNYLRATGLRLGLLVNFCHHPGVEIQRVIL